MLERRYLGKTGIEVSRLCFGSLTMGPLQANLPLEEGVALLCAAFERGVNFIDTAELYNNYAYIAGAIKASGRRPVIAIKTYAYTAEQASASLDKALRELCVDYIDIILLHEQESLLTLKGHLPALEYFWKARDKGKVRAVGLSCHTIAAVKAAVTFNGIDVVHPLLNYKGIGIMDGSVEEMLDAIKEAHNQGIGIYTMKPLAGGHLLHDVEKAFSFLLKEESINAVAVGMASEAELEFNCRFFAGRKIPNDLKRSAGRRPRRLLLEKELCQMCGKCVERCPTQALTIKDNKLLIEQAHCLLCGYCGSSCPQFCLRIG
ncbi:MAG: 4Fe-4S binding protein [Firmicutes bacterium]|nr:4Fe-4S binding protein [Bacillota bacterium]